MSKLGCGLWATCQPIKTYKLSWKFRHASLSNLPKNPNLWVSLSLVCFGFYFLFFKIKIKIIKKLKFLYNMFVNMQI